MRKAGVANPLGSNLNIYLMYLVAPLYVMLRWKLKKIPTDYSGSKN